MNKHGLGASALIVLAALLPSAASAQKDDGAYCAALSASYQKYIGSSSSRRFTSDVEAEVAMAKCQSGDTVAAIPTLERKLRDSKIDLPPRG